MAASEDPKVAAKRACAFAAVDSLPAEAGQVVGVGSGSTVVFVVERLVARHHSADDAFSVKAAVPTSFQARQLIVEGGLPLADLDRFPELDVAIDGADELVEAADPRSSLCLIKGGGGCQTGEKLVAACAKRLVVVADAAKPSPVLGRRWRRGVPVAVLPDARVPVQRALAALGAASAGLRMAKAKAGPVVDDYGCVILDADFGEIADPAALCASVDALPGVVSCGLFTGKLAAAEAFVGEENGTVRRIARATE